MPPPDPALAMHDGGNSAVGRHGIIVATDFQDLQCQFMYIFSRFIDMFQGYVDCIDPSMAGSRHAAFSNLRRTAASTCIEIISYTRSARHV
jgi:hypothetical protein